MSVEKEGIQKDEMKYAVCAWFEEQEMNFQSD